MARDATTLAIFTTADDAIQGLLGLHACINAAYDLVPKDQLVERLPKGQFRLTHEWARHYDPSKLVDATEQFFEFVQCRTSLTSLVSIVEAAVERLIGRLDELGRIVSPPDRYKTQLRWVFETVKDANIDASTMLARLPETCGDVDNARRLRNSIAHNNGKYDDMYGNDAIDDGWVRVQTEREYAIYRRDGHMPIFLTNRRFEHFCRSHVEALHVLHNTIQSKFFGHHEGFNYRREGKRIEWYRIMSGRKSVGM
jgi:hypothetical protein